MHKNKHPKLIRRRAHRAPSSHVLAKALLAAYVQSDRKFTPGMRRALGLA